MSPVAAAVARPYTVAVAVILTALFSVLALQRIPIQLKPTVDEPQITIQTTYRGASAVEVEEQVTRALEDVLQSVEGLVEMVSTSTQGRSQITLKFSYGTSTRLAVVDVVNKLSQVPRLPDEADEPVVDIASPDENQPVMWIAFDSSYQDAFVRRVVIDEVESKLKRVPGVSSLLVVGGSPREVQVRFDPEALVARGITIDALAGAVARANQNLRGGNVETAGRQLAVRTIGRADVARGLEDIVVREVPGGGEVRLGEVARAVDTYAETDGFVKLNGRPGVAVGVRRQAGANVVEMIRELERTLAAVNDGFRARGVDITLRPVYRETTYIDAAMSFVTGNLVVGALLATGVLLFFLRSGRTVFIVGLAIPISLAGVFLVLHALGRTLNVISLAGIAFASGMVVDNAIVVLENVFRHLERGKSPARAAIDGGQEVWGGVLASTLTTVAVFAPIVIQGDEASQLFVDVAIAISAAVAISLAVALTVVPVLAALLFRAAPAGAGAPGAEAADAGAPGTQAAGVAGSDLGALGRAYGRFATLFARPPSAAGVRRKVGLVLLVIGGSLGALGLAPPAEYLPTGNRNLIMFFADPIPGTRPEAIQANFAPFEAFLLAQPEVERTFTVTGSRFNGGGVVLADEHATADGLAGFHKRLFGPAGGLAGFRFVVPVRSSLFTNPGKQFDVELSGPDFAALERGAKLLEEALRGVEGVEFVRSSLVTGNPELQVEVDEVRAKQLGLDTAEVGRTVELVVAGQRLTTLIDGGREVDVNLVAPPELVASPEDLAGLRFLGRGGEPVALSSVARVVRTTGPQSIRRLERERNVLLTVNIAAGAPLEQVVEEVERRVLPEVGAALGPAYALRVGGSADKLRATLRALTGGFGLSVLITYLLLVSLFRSWVTPLVILVSVPFALAGGLVGIRLASELSGGTAAFDVISMLGFVILAGLVVNNAILIVHQANQNVLEGGMGAREALADSVRTRLRPILMSVVTTVFGMLPLAIGGGAGAELYQGLGAVIVGGLAVSTVFTLFVVPALLSLGHDLRAAVAAAQPPAPWPPAPRPGSPAPVAAGAAAT